jgi:hypothetical protein
MSIRITFPESRHFPVQITNKDRYKIDRHHITCPESLHRILDDFHVQEIVLTNKRSDKTSFSQNDIETMAATIIFFLNWKHAAIHFEPTGTVDQQHAFRFALTSSRFGIRKLKEVSERCGFFWTLTKTPSSLESP